MRKRMIRICIASFSVLTCVACSMEGIDTGTTVEQSQSISDRTSSVAYQKGKEHLAAGYLGLALEKFKSALAGDPSSTAILNALAVTYGRLGRHDLAELYFDRALALDPTFSVALNNVGYSMVKRGRNEEALIYFEQALKHEQLESSRRLILANRQKAMDNLRVARQNGSVAVVEKVSLSRTEAETALDDPCGLSVGGAIDRSGARVFTLNTGGSDSAPVADRPTVNCRAPIRSRVAMVSTQIGGGTATVSTVRQLASTGPASIVPTNVPQEPAAETVVETGVLAKNSLEKMTISQPVEETVKETASEPADPKAGVTGNLKVEISNGAGRNKLAARMRKYLEAKGLPVSYLTNDARFDNAQTTIFYKSGERAVAENFAKQLPVSVKFVETGMYYADIRIRLGADILAFDTSVLYASAYGDVNA